MWFTSWCQALDVNEVLNPVSTKAFTRSAWHPEVNDLVRPLTWSAWHREVDHVVRRREAVKAMPEPARGPVTREDVQTLRDAKLGELAEIAERQIAHG